MFIKQLKYDLLFSRNAFFGMGALLIGISIILSLAIHVMGTGVTGAMETVWVGLVFSISATAVAVASVFQLYTFYKRSLFGNSGYLMLTLPVERCSLLVSKLVVSLLWINYMVIVNFIMALILFTGMGEVNWNDMGYNSPYFSWSIRDTLRLIEGVITMNIFPLVFISIAYLGITLGNSVFGRWRVNGFVAGIASIVYLMITFWITYRTERFVTSIAFRWTTLSRDLGMVSYRTIYIVCFVFVVVAVALTNYLLQKRVELQ